MREKGEGPLPPDSEMEEEQIRPASGPGGQHVNRTACAVRLSYRFEGSSFLSDSAKERLRNMAASRISEGVISFVAKEYRSLSDNRRAARARLSALLSAAKKQPKKRKATRPTRASKERRLNSKSVRSKIKASRSASTQDS